MELMETLSVDPLTISSQSAVVNAIRQRILSGELASGQRLIVAEICEWVDAKRGIVNAALTELAHEGLVERIPNRGARVRVVNLHEALQIVEARMALESLCVAKAAEKITDDEIGILRAMGKEMEELAKRRDTDGYAKLTQQLVMTYLRIADQTVAAELIVRLRDRNSRHRFRLIYRSDRAQVSFPYWQEIIKAICDRNPEAARAAMQRHSENVQQAMKALA